MNTISRLTAALGLALASTTLLAAQPWNQFRGGNGDGHAPGASLPLKFNESKNIQWRVPIHDTGWSSPVVWENQAWVTTAKEDGSELFAVCVDIRNGKVLHDIKVFDVEKPQNEHPGLNTHATPTPIIEAGRIYLHFGAYGTACLDTQTGRKLWERRDLKCDHRVRPASSPIIDGSSLFLTYDGVDAQFIAALDKTAGKTLWRKKRSVKNDLGDVLKQLGEKSVKETNKNKPNDNRKSYATPTVIEHNGRKQLISPAAEATYAYDLKTGEEIWRIRHKGWGWNVACRPIYRHGLVYLITGIAKHLVAIDPSDKGDVTDTHVKWTTRRSTPSISSPVIVGDYLFMVSDSGGLASCLDAKTGEEIWRERLGGIQNHWVSPVCAGDKIYFFSREGNVSVIAAAPEFNLLAKNQFNDGFIANPAIVDDTMIHRSPTHLYRIAKGYKIDPLPKAKADKSASEKSGSSGTPGCARSTARQAMRKSPGQKRT